MKFKKEINLMNKEFNGFDEMVEALEENEDMVECKECFDLVPKVDCERAEVGYICPTCRGLRTAPAQARFVDPYDSYTQDFPEVTEYDPDSVVEYEKEPGLGDALADLIKDEYEAIDGYEVADETIQHADIDEDEKDEILDTLDHIKEEEEEHIDELKELCPECDPVAEPETEPKAEPEKLEEAADDEAAAEEAEVEEIPEEDIPEEEAEDSEENENEEVSDLDSAYEAALEIANESGVGQVFGYARKETEEFVAVEPFEVDDPEAVEDDLMAVYDDVAYAYVAYPEKTLEESLFESLQLTEANIFTGEDKNLNSLFTQGYEIRIRDAGTNQITKTYKEKSFAAAEKIATRASKAYPNMKIDLIGAPLKADHEKLGDAAQQLIKSKDSDTVLAIYQNGKLGVDNVSKITKTVKNILKFEKTLARGSEAKAEKKAEKQAAKDQKLADKEAAKAAAEKAKADEEEAALTSSAEAVKATIEKTFQELDQEITRIRIGIQQDKLENPKAPVAEKQIMAFVNDIIAPKKSQVTTAEDAEEFKEEALAKIQEILKTTGYIKDKAEDETSTTTNTEKTSTETTSTEAEPSAADQADEEAAPEVDPKIKAGLKTASEVFKSAIKNAKDRRARRNAQRQANTAIEKALKSVGVNLNKQQQGQVRQLLFGESLEMSDIDEETKNALDAVVEAFTAKKPILNEEYHKYANPAEITAMDNLKADVDKIVNQVVTDLVAAGYDDLDYYDSDCYMSGNNTCTITMFIGSEDTFEAGETEDLQDHMANQVEEALAQIKLPPEIVKIQGGAMFPDNSIMDEDDVANGLTRGEITVEVTFARNLM
jgi:hypothetical protein